MEMMVSDIKTASLLTFENNRSQGIVFNSIVDDTIRGILEEDYFIDIETKQLYPILFCYRTGELYEIPKTGIQYVYGVETCRFELEEKNELLKKAQEAHDWYVNLKELEESGKIISFQKRKIRKEVG